MKAIRVPQFGGPDVLRYDDVPDPIVGAGELLVRVRASGVNPVDTYVREGKYPGLTAKPPFIAGTELAGEIISDGPRKGERVYTPLTANGRNLGAHAELVAVKAAWRLPDHLSFEQGAAIPVAFGTAYRALVEVGGLKPGDTVLIHGASGGVGNAATQLAAALGAIVIGTASTDAGKQAALAAGATKVFDHKKPGYVDEIEAALPSIDVRTGEDVGINLIVELLANVNLEADLELIAPRGRIVVVGSRGRIEIDPRRTMGKESLVTGTSLWNGGRDGFRRAYAAIGALLQRRAIVPVVAKTFPLSDAARAQEAVMQGGSTGKVVLTH